MKALLLPLLPLLCACGPDVTAWKGTWAGSGTLNTGRQPLPLTGALTVADGARFTGSTDPMGSPATTFSATLVAATVEEGKATFTAPSSVTLTVTPQDDCVYALGLDAAGATRTGDSLEATARGRFTVKCGTGSAETGNYLLELFATRRQ